MGDTNYPGIDYGMGQTNIDRETGIRYGIINMNALNEWAWDSFEADYGEPTCGHCGNEVVEFDGEKHDGYEVGEYNCSDYACETCEKVYDSSECYGDESLGHILDDSEYYAVVDNINDMMVIKSPYYTFAQFCSPCAPGACHLEHPLVTKEESKTPKESFGIAGLKHFNNNRCYCLGHDWFDGDKAPYPVYSVATGELVE